MSGSKKSKITTNQLRCVLWTVLFAYILVIAYVERATFFGDGDLTPLLAFGMTLVTVGLLADWFARYAGRQRRRNVGEHEGGSPGSIPKWRWVVYPLLTISGVVSTRGQLSMPAVVRPFKLTDTWTVVFNVFIIAVAVAGMEYLMYAVNSKMGSGEGTSEGSRRGH